MHGKDRKFQSDEEVSIQSSVEEGASPYKVAFNIMKTIIGAGIFSTPYALKQCGFVFGMLLIIPMGALFCKMCDEEFHHPFLIAIHPILLTSSLDNHDSCERINQE